MATYLCCSPLRAVLLLTKSLQRSRHSDQLEVSYEDVPKSASTVKEHQEQVAASSFSQGSFSLVLKLKLVVTSQQPLEPPDSSPQHGSLMQTALVGFRVVEIFGSRLLEAVARWPAVCKGHFGLAGQRGRVARGLALPQAVVMAGAAVY